MYSILLTPFELLTSSKVFWIDPNILRSPISISLYFYYTTLRVDEDIVLLKEISAYISNVEIILVLDYGALSIKIGNVCWKSKYLCRWFSQIVTLNKLRYGNKDLGRGLPFVSLIKINIFFCFTYYNLPIIIIYSIGSSSQRRRYIYFLLMKCATNTSYFAFKRIIQSCRQVSIRGKEKF